MTYFVLETDAPYFYERVGSRKFSIPADVVNVAAKVAALKCCNIDDVLYANRSNVKRIYHV